ncbi:hypothetical protein GR11A_00159 [Vibrio phage vB_VcorM_GR11A]|nr:hypothetical protein GR11A_00159 [Vibrio phage vB_VcorM_GR11A]
MANRDMPLVTQILTMVELQNRNNKIQHCDDWMERGDDNRPDHRAAYIELVEGLVHKGWGQWWKKAPELTDSQRRQFNLELVDVFHFLMSLEMRDVTAQSFLMDPALPKPCPIQSTTQTIFEAFAETATPQEMGDDQDINGYIDHLVGYLALHREVDWAAFVNILDMAEFDFSELYAWYIGKNALNMFRTCNGYKAGDYLKNEWGLFRDQEDNVALETFIVNHTGEYFTFREVYDYLAEQYETVYSQHIAQDTDAKQWIDNRQIAWGENDDGLCWAFVPEETGVEPIWHQYKGWSGNQQPVFE